MEEEERILGELKLDHEAPVVTVAPSRRSVDPETSLPMPDQWASWDSRRSRPITLWVILGACLITAFLSILVWWAPQHAHRSAGTPSPAPSLSATPLPNPTAVPTPAASPAPIAHLEEAENRART